MANEDGVATAKGRPLSAIQIRPHNGIASGPSSPASSMFSTESRAIGRRGNKSIQDRFYAKILEQVATARESDEELGDEEVDLYPDEEIKEKVKHASRGFSLPAVDLNLMRLNARIGALFEQQEYTIGIFTWAKPVHTLSFLAIHTLIWLNPHLIPGLPLLQACYMIIMPAFLARHPKQTNDPRMAPINFGPPTAPPAYLKSATPLSRDFRRNMRDLQHSMEAMNKAHEDLNKYVVPQFNFSDEAITSEIFVATFFFAIFVFTTAHLIYWPTVFLLGGWLGIIGGHPAVKEILSTPESASNSKQRLHDLLDKVRAFIHDDIILDEAPQVRQVEVFELQRHKAEIDTWKPWLYSPTPYDPLSPERVAGARPKGTQFFEEVLPPAGWKWKEKKWTLDLSSTEWIQQRMITGVEVETAGDMWVYDIPAEDEEEYMSAVAASTTMEKDKVKGVAKSGWEEASGIEKRGEWRRRRWTRDVERKHMRVSQ